MKKLELKGMQMLTKEQMKKVAGGKYPTCTYTINQNCGGGSFSVEETDCGSASSCQTLYDGSCARDICCDNIDCV